MSGVTPRRVHLQLNRTAYDFVFDPPATQPLPPPDDSVPVLRIAPGVSYEEIDRGAQARAWDFARQRRKRNRAIDAAERARLSRFTAEKVALTPERIAAGERHNCTVAGVARCECRACVGKRARQRETYARRKDKVALWLITSAKGATAEYVGAVPGIATQGGGPDSENELRPQHGVGRGGLHEVVE